jgi:hypothetical protein
MGQMIEMETLNEAIPLYIGVGVSPYPKEDEARLFERFGDDAGRAVLEAVRAIISELQTIEPDWEKQTLVSGSKWAVEKLRSNYDDLDDKSGSALEWLYSWWWK